MKENKRKTKGNKTINGVDTLSTFSKHAVQKRARINENVANVSAACFENVESVSTPFIVLFPFVSLGFALFVIIFY